MDRNLAPFNQWGSVNGMRCSHNVIPQAGLPSLQRAPAAPAPVPVDPLKQNGPERAGTGVGPPTWQKIEEQLLDQFRLGQITREEFIRKHEIWLDYSRGEAEQFADETIEFLEHMKD